MNNRHDFVVILPPFPEENKPVIFRPVTNRARAFSEGFKAIAKRGIALGIVVPAKACHDTLDAITRAGLTIEVL